MNKKEGQYNVRSAAPVAAKLPALEMRAAFDPTTYNAEAGTIDIVWSTGMKYLRNGWDGKYYEELSMDEMHVRLDRLNAGANLIDNHKTYESVKDSVIGVIERAWIEGGKGYATIRLSKREDLKGVVQDIVDGILRNISVGYRVYEFEQLDGGDETIPTYRAVDWEPFELSLVSVPVDYLAGTRSPNKEEFDVTIRGAQKPESLNTENNMKREQIIAMLTKRGITVDETSSDAELMSILERALGENGGGAPKPAAAPAPAPAPAGDGDAERAAVEAERKRSAEIFEAVRKANLDPQFAEQLIKEGKSIDESRQAIIDKFAENGSTAPTRSASVSSTDRIEQARAAAMADAIILRADPSAINDETRITNAREYRGMSLLRMAEESLNARGVQTRGLSPREIAEKALYERSMSTSDFPIILGNTINRQLRAAYALQERTFMPFTRRGSAKDFREMTKVQLSGVMDAFESVAEGAEYKASSMSEAKETYKVAKYGRLINVTWETLINDDLDAFSRIPMAIAAKAAQKQSDIVWGIITGNPNMSDSVALFHATHGNLAASGTDLTTDAIAAARAAMRKQKGLENDYINVTPQFLIVGPDKETKAQQIVNATIVATKTTDTNVFRSAFQIIVEPRLTGNQWYLAASPNQIDTIEYSFLDGEGELFTEQRNGFEVDGLQIKARMVFGAKAIDWRGLYKNAGA